MGKIWMPGSGGGADLDLDAVTAGRPDVLAGKVIVDKNSEPLTGTMPNRGAVSQALNAGGSYSIPEGYHTGTGKVTANSLASQTGATATAAHILSGQTAWVNGSKVTGNMPIQGADVSGTDRAWSTNISCWEGAACLGVRNAHYLNGVNWIQGNIPNFYAGNIKKGVNMGGLVGTFEGYVPTATDLYLRGNNIKGWTGDPTYVTFDSGQISMLNSASRGRIWTTQQIKLTGYNWLNVQGYTDTGGNTLKTLRLWQRIASNNRNLLGYLDLSAYGSGNYIYGFDISSHQITDYIELVPEYMGGAIYRIWLT